MDKFQVLKQYFGYEVFRDGQEPLIDGILAGRDVFGIMPTGSGKSICFQVPALMLEGITLVISPLISLMKDQVTALNQAGIHAAYLNSSLTIGQYHKALSLAMEGRYTIIYVAPERLETETFLNFALSTRIAMVAVDEAHCVSQWGQDFRPSYLKISRFIEKLPKRPIVSAFTATATREVREDIVDLLALQNPVMVTTGYDRPNLYLGVQTPKDKYAALKTFVDTHDGQCGIVYCLTRKLVDEVTDRLRADGISATRYHAGLDDRERRKNQDDFIYDRCQVMVATNAFGMGIDKSNVRYVIHYNMPKSLEAFYQEIGRCARDQEPGECILFYSGQDVVTNQYFIDNNQDNQELDDLTRRLVQERDRERLRKMTCYCFTNECLRAYILRYFGEYGSNYCGNCLNCLTQFETVDVTQEAKSLVGCVYTSRQRYGVAVIMDTVRGANTAKIRQYRMDNNPFYGTLAGVPAYRLRMIMNHLMLQGFLTVTGDEYAIVKLTKESSRILDAGESVIMKMAREREYPPKVQTSGREKRNTAAGISMSPNDAELFEKLRNLRIEIARKEHVPPYIVFSDKTLVSMCMVKPMNKAMMLTVSGIGALKYDKYGEQFLSLIREALETQKQAENSSETNHAVPGSYTSGTPAGNYRSEATAGGKRVKSEFAMSEEVAGQLKYADVMTLSELAAQINDLRDDNAMKRLTIKSVEQWLLDEGYLESWISNGRCMKKLTEKGKDFGILAEDHVSERGTEYQRFFYTEKGQRGIVAWLLRSGSGNP